MGPGFRRGDTFVLANTPNKRRHRERSEAATNNLPPAAPAAGSQIKRTPPQGAGGIRNDQPHPQHLCVSAALRAKTFLRVFAPSREPLLRAFLLRCFAATEDRPRETPSFPSPGASFH